MTIEAINQELFDRLSTRKNEIQHHKNLHALPSSIDVERLVDSLMSIPPSETGIFDLRLFMEMQSLSDFIQVARQEIVEMRPDDILNTHLPIASDELSAIVSATEAATNTILESVEKIEELTHKMPPEMIDSISEAVTKVYEACNFQDITGQRISKVVSALQEIEKRVDMMLSALGDEMSNYIKFSSASLHTVKQEKSDDVELINGPQLPDQAVDQATVDALFA